MTRLSIQPENWQWRDGVVEPGGAVLVDIDGVLSDAVSRQHYLEAPRRDWNAFFEACGDDPVIEEVKVLLDNLDPNLSVVLLTARPQRVAHLTVGWLHRYGIRWDLLITRAWGDYELAREYKQGSLWDLRAFGFDIRFGIEDDRRNVDMLRKEGVPCVYIHSGYYD